MTARFDERGAYGSGYSSQSPQTHWQQREREQVQQLAPNTATRTTGPDSTTYNGFQPLPIRSTSPTNAKQSQTSFKTNAKGVFKKTQNLWSRATSPPPSKSDLNANALVAEIQRTAQIDVSNVVAQFKDLNRDIEKLCDQLGGFASTLWKQTHSSNSANRDSNMRAQVESLEDSAYYGTMSILASYICDRLLAPFHPLMDAALNYRTMETYRRLSVTELQRDLAEWRSREFNSFESTVTDSQGQKFFHSALRHLTSDIEERVLLNVGVDAPIPSEIRRKLVDTLAKVYDWNLIVKQDVLDYDLIAYVPRAGDVWDASTMESIEKVRNSHLLSAKTRIVNPVSIGLRARAARGRYQEALSVPQVKAKVLLPQRSSGSGSTWKPPAGQTRGTSGGGGMGSGLPDPRRTAATHHSGSPTAHPNFVSPQRPGTTPPTFPSTASNRTENPAVIPFPTRGSVDNPDHIRPYTDPSSNSNQHWKFQILPPVEQSSSHMTRPTVNTRPPTATPIHARTPSGESTSTLTRSRTLSAGRSSAAHAKAAPPKLDNQQLAMLAAERTAAASGKGADDARTRTRTSSRTKALSFLKSLRSGFSGSSNKTNPDSTTSTTSTNKSRKFDPNEHLNKGNHTRRRSNSAGTISGIPAAGITAAELDKLRRENPSAAALVAGSRGVGKGRERPIIPNWD